MVGSILRGLEVQEESQSLCRLFREEAVQLRAFRLPRAASPRGLHGPVSSTGALDARAGVGEAAAAGAQGRCLSPTSELFSPAAAARSSRCQLPKLWESARGLALGRALAGSPPAGREGPCPGLAATCRGLRPLPLRVKLCRLSALGAGPGAAQLLQRVQPAERGRGAGEGGLASRLSSRARALEVPPPAQGLEEPGRREGAEDKLGPTPANQRAPRPPARLNPFPTLPRVSWVLARRVTFAFNSALVSPFGVARLLPDTTSPVTVMSFFCTLKSLVLFLSQCLRSGGTFCCEPLLQQLPHAVRTICLLVFSAPPFLSQLKLPGGWGLHCLSLYPLGFSPAETQ